MSWIELYGEDFFENLSMKELARDESYLRITNNGKQIPLFLFHHHRECIECDFYKKGLIYADDVWKVENSYIYRISKNGSDGNQEENTICELKEPLGEFGVYNLSIENDYCTLVTSKEPVNIYLPILTVTIIFTSLLFIWFCIKRISSYIYRNEKNTDEQPKTSIIGKERTKSLDTIRGLCIATMIFVNLGAGGYDILDHAIWNGFHLADFVFPIFLWIMGACIPISLISSWKRGVTNAYAIRATFKRAIKLFCLGLFLNSGIYIDEFRIMGVLQRLAICYLVVSLICIYFLDKKILHSGEETDILSSVRATKCGWCIMFLITLVYLSIITLIKDKDCESGYFGPGGLHHHGKYMNCTGGAIGYLDRTLLGKHLFQHPTSTKVYQSQYFDPEGIIGSLSAIVHTFIGVQAGVILLIYKEYKHKIFHWTYWAITTGIFGGMLCGFSKEHGWLPINKNLWSLSFVLVTSSTAFFLLIICFVIVDLKKWWTGFPFFHAGMNSILMYIGHQVTSSFFPFSWKLNNYDTQTHFLFLLENITTTTLWILIALYLYKIEFFLKV